MRDFALLAASPRPPHIDVQACFPPLQPTSGDTSHTAETMSQKPAPVGLQRRALRLFPHKRLARQRYLQAHAELRENLTRIRGR